MARFVYDDTVPDVDGVILFPVPFLSWFNDSVVSALVQMTISNNWIGEPRDDDQLENALSWASRAIAEMKVLNFNPFPPGMIFPFGGTTAPGGYLLCDGSTISATTYPELFDAIGYNFGGSGDDFVLPNLINNVAVGAGDTYAIADSGGLAVVTLTTAQLAAHDHSASAPTVNDPTHSHVESVAAPTAITIGAGVPAPSAIPAVGVTGASLTGITVNAPTIGSTGGDEAHENMPPFQALTYIIYAGR